MDPKQIPAKRRVHIVDDESEVREALALLLSTAGIETATHESAEAYLEAVPLAEPACVILDNRLPGLSGLELLGRIADSGGQAAVIMMTGHGDVPTAVAAMKLGAFHFAEKPFDAEALLIGIQQAIKRSEAALGRENQLHSLRTDYGSLTQREREVMALVASGLLNKQVGGELGISEITVKAHRGNVMRKMKANSFANLVNMAARLRVTRSMTTSVAWS